MKLKIIHLARGVRSEMPEVCCGTIVEAINNGAIANNIEFIEAFSDNYEPLNIFSYDDTNSLEGFYPIRFCPFCGEKIDIEFIDGRPTPQD